MELKVPASKQGKLVVIDPDQEEIISLADAAAFIQRKFGGRKPSANTMARWCLHGLRGQRLESLKRGGQRVTSKQAIFRFFQKSAEPVLPPKVAAILDTLREDAIEKQLAAEGL